MSDPAPSRTRTRVTHGWPVRLMHGINAAAVLALIASGWEIYNAAPFYPLVFPARLTLGGGLTGALLWHFAFMWVLIANGAAYLAYRVALRRGYPALLPVSLRGLVSDARAAWRIRLGHGFGAYNQVQRTFYVGVCACLAVSVLSGFALWKPVQLQGLTDLMGGYEAARRVHFWGMAGVVAFLVVHLVMVALVPKTLLAIVFGVTVGDRPGPEVHDDEQRTPGLARP